MEPSDQYKLLKGRFATGAHRMSSFLVRNEKGFEVMNSCPPKCLPPAGLYLANRTAI